jgi:hypothetical protein
MPREGLSIAWLIRHQMLLFSSRLIVCKMPEKWISSPASLGRIRQSRKWTHCKPPAWFFNIFIGLVQASTPSRHWVWVSSLGFGIPAYKACLMTLLRCIGRVVPLANAWYARLQKCSARTGSLKGNAAVTIWWHRCLLPRCISTVWLSRVCIWCCTAGVTG